MVSVITVPTGVGGSVGAGVAVAAGGWVAVGAPGVAVGRGGVEVAAGGVGSGVGLGAAATVGVGLPGIAIEDGVAEGPAGGVALGVISGGAAALLSWRCRAVCRPRMTAISSRPETAPVSARRRDIRLRRAQARAGKMRLAMVQQILATDS